MQSSPGTENDPNKHFKLMEDRLLETEGDSKELTKMLLDLGISPTSSSFSPNTFVSPLFDASITKRNVSKSPEKSVRFSNEFNQKSTSKKDTIKPLQLNVNALNKEEKGLDSKSVDRFSKLVSRLCKTESVVQSLKLSMCTLKATHEAADKEKNKIIEKLKHDVKEMRSQVKNHESALEEERRHSEAHKRRWEEAEVEVKDLQNRLHLQTTMAHESGFSEDAVRDKFARKFEELKLQVSREKEVRVAVEDSHQAVLSRIQDMENAIDQERNQNSLLRDENNKLKEINETLKIETSSFHSKADDLANRLAVLTDELNSKEKAIRRLIEEQQHHHVSSSTMVNEQASLNKELNQCSIVLEVQKAAFSQLESENSKLKTELEEAKMIIIEKEDLETRRKEEEEMRRNEIRLSKEQLQDKHRSEINLAIRNEKKRYRELEERNKLLEECLKEQEKVINIKEEEYREKEKENDERLFEEKKKTSRLIKESEQIVKTKENLIRDLNRASSDVARDKEFLHQQLEEIKLELEGLVKERDRQEEENQRLLNRIATVEQQEQAYKRAQDLVHASNNAKSELAYENGKLQTRVEQLEDELRQLANVQSQVVQLRAANRAFDQKYSRVTTELAAVKVDAQRSSAHVKQLQNSVQRKEEDFNLAISARDDAVREKEAILSQLDAVKEQERNKLNLLKRDLHDCRSDNERLTLTINDFSSRYAEMQSALNNVQAQLGRKDTQLSALREEKRKQESELSELGNLVARLQSTLDDRDLDEQARITPALEALEKAREENIRLSSRLEEVLNKNTQLSDDLNKTKTDLDIQRERVENLLQQQAANERDAVASSQAHSDHLQQMKEQFAKERAAIRKQLQLQINEIKKSHESSQARNSQLIKGNTDLRSKIVDYEQVISKLKEKLKQQKSSLERHQRDKKSQINTSQKIKVIDEELKELEQTKMSYIEKNKEQQQVISTFNSEVASLKDDITALTEAHIVARDRNKQLEAQFEKERSEKNVLKDKNKMLEEAVRQAIEDRKDAEERMRKIQVESIHVQENLQEAQAWFKGKFQSLQNEISKQK